MERITKWYLKQSRARIFLLSLFGIPFYLWLFSLIYQLDNKRKNGKNHLKHLIVGIITLYPIIYLLSYLVTTIFVLKFKLFVLMQPIMPLHITAMICGLLLIIVSANSYGKFEKAKNVKTFSSLAVFFMLWFYVIGIWELQPNLNKYVMEQ